MMPFPHSLRLSFSTFFFFDHQKCDIAALNAEGTYGLDRYYWVIMCSRLVFWFVFV